MKKKMKKWFSCIMATAMVMSTVNLPTNILASDFDDGVEISVEDENEDAPEVVVDGEEDVIEDSDVTDEVPDDISSENDDEQLFSDHVDEDIDAVVDDGDSDSVGITQSEFDSKLNELRKQYPNYSVWNGSFDGGTQCFGFARLMGYNVFGTKPSTWGRVNSINNVKAGDLVQYGNTSGSGHTIFVTNVSGDTITFVDGNGNGN